jgi:hypothetical protein
MCAVLAANNILLQIFDLIRDIFDPEHPLTLEALNVLSLKVIGSTGVVLKDLTDMNFQQNVTVDAKAGHVHVFFTPTVPHCSASTLIGLCIRLVQ